MGGRSANTQQQSTDQGGISIEVTASGFVNAAFHHNSIPFLHELKVVSEKLSEGVRDLALELVSEPPFLKRKRWNVAYIAPDGTVRLSDLDVVLDGGFLSGLTEASTALVTLSLTKDGKELAKREIQTRLLAPDEWGGISTLPEILAAFVRPNDPAVETVLKAAAEILRESGRQPGIDGYSSGRRERVWEIVAAIWSAVCSLRLDYVVPPASFETTGQKIRSPSHIIEKRLATCLDLALLFASCLEQAGLNSLIVLMKEHSFAGCWLSREDFSTSVIEEAMELRKRVQLGELVLFETTLVTAADPPGFRIACDGGNAQVAESRDGNFELAIDVKRARQKRILPLPQTSEAESSRTEGGGPGEDPAALPHLDDPPLLPEISKLRESEPEAETAAARIERWKRRLLDLSLNNRLLNLRQTKRAIPIVCPEAGQLAERLTAGTMLKIEPRPEVMAGGDPRNAEIYWSRHREDAVRTHALEALSRNEIFANVAADELDARLTLLYRAAREGLEEGGANILYLALGFLRWKRDDKDISHKAPLLLVPVSLDRRSVRSRFRLRAHEDEPRFNPTLLEMLRQDFSLSIPGMDRELSNGEQSLDVAAIWTAVRSAIRDIKGWEVTDEVALSTFSFTKFLMWKDLVERADALKRNAVVRHLMETPNQAYAQSGGFVDPKTLDQTRAPEGTFCPLLADSSQLSAVTAAAQGLDFVLVGPPGTGKSQTIANMIAQNLAEGKRVLFVSAKMAALDVVYRRLKEIGLADFCLELHSNKARKLEVLDQLRSAWAVREELDPRDWRRDAARLKATRDLLNRYVERLHLRHPNGLTAYDAFGMVVRWRDVPSVALSWTGANLHDEEHLARLRETVGRLAVNAEALGELSQHPLAGVGRAEWAPSWQTAFSEAVREAEGRLGELRSATEDFAHAVNIDVPKSRDRFEGLVTFARLLPEGAGCGFTLTGDADEAVESLEAGASAIERRSSILSETSVRYRDDATALDVGALEAAWRSAESRWLVRRMLGRRRVRRALALVAERKPRNPSGDIARLTRAKALEQEIASLEERNGRAVRIWKGVGSNPQELRAASNWGRSARASLAAIVDNPTQLLKARPRIALLCDDGTDLLRPEGMVGRAASRLTEANEAWRQAEQRLQDLAEAPVLLSSGTAHDWSASMAERLTRWRESAAVLRTWCAWRAARTECFGIGLGPLADALEHGTLEPSSAARAFEVNYCRWWSAALIDSDEVLRGFVPAEHERRIEVFRELDRDFVRLTARYIRSKLAANLPEPGASGKDGEWALLNRELAKKKRHLPLRQLISQLPTALTRLTPCLLMSPLSVAQYLAHDAQPFDVVIFDEASQIAVWDAVGALARGKQAVVVGDPQQLPPTSFFDRADDSIDIDADNVDQESILDELAGTLPRQQLLWHYRSRHESLIAFSNYRYYNGNLITFPSSITDDRALSFVHVPDGIYERGTSRTNRAEAVAVVADVVRRLRDPAFVADNGSIGVVTFNAEQQQLIEDLLDAERRRDPDLDRFFQSSADRIEPVFVKNLENVQGDERDVILFSIAFGPDAAGKVTMNFGPLNKSGGHRRLNVAVTRARREMRVFATLRAEQIDLNRTSAPGVRDLKHFLEFAERGPKALAEAVQSVGGEHESPFERAVEESLTAKGWQVRRQVGVSGFRIDLGVVHPDAPGKFLAGVECDGATYHRSATARDRDRLRDMILTNLGWHILRTWSTDWWVNSSGAAEALNARLTEVLASDRAKQPSTNIESTADERVGHEIGPMAAVLVASSSVEGESAHLVSSIEPDKNAQGDESRIHGTAEIEVFHQADPREVEAVPDPEAFFEHSYIPRLLRMIRHVVDAEAPIKDDVLVRRIARVHGFQRSGGRIRSHVLSLVPREIPRKKESDSVWFWPIAMGESLSPIRFRFPSPSLEPRPADEICLEELAALARHILTLSDKGDVIAEMVSAIGLRRLRSQTRARLEEALRIATSPQSA